MNNPTAQQIETVLSLLKAHLQKLLSPQEPQEAPELEELPQPPELEEPDVDQTVLDLLDVLEPLDMLLADPRVMQELQKLYEQQGLEELLEEVLQLLQQQQQGLEQLLGKQEYENLLEQLQEQTVPEQEPTSSANSDTIVFAANAPAESKQDHPPTPLPEPSTDANTEQSENIDLAQADVEVVGTPCDLL